MFIFPDQILVASIPEAFGAMYKASQSFLTLSKMKGSADRNAESENPWLMILRLRPCIFLLMAVWLFQVPGTTGNGAYPFDFWTLLAVL